MFSKNREKTIEKDSAVDAEILDYLATISHAVNTWNDFNFPFQGPGPAYVNFNVQGLKDKFDYDCLERVVTRKDGKICHGTVIGEYANKLHINLDINFYAQAVELSEIEKDVSLVTQFTSVSAFELQYLGFYLKTHNDYIKETAKAKTGGGFNNNFWANMRRSELYLENIQYVGKKLIEKK